MITLPAGEVDESVVTAESLPVHEAPGTQVGGAAHVPSMGVNEPAGLAGHRQSDFMGRPILGTCWSKRRNALTGRGRRSP